jgi:hypothetical protein
VSGTNGFSVVYMTLTNSSTPANNQFPYIVPIHIACGLRRPHRRHCEKGGRTMATYPNSALREEVQRYLTGCEYLLAAANSPQPFTEEELAIIRYYAAEVGKIPK